MLQLNVYETTPRTMRMWWTGDGDLPYCPTEDLPSELVAERIAAAAALGIPVITHDGTNSESVWHREGGKIVIDSAPPTLDEVASWAALSDADRSELDEAVTA